MNRTWTGYWRQADWNIENISEFDNDEEQGTDENNRESTDDRRTEYTQSDSSQSDLDEYNGLWILGTEDDIDEGEDPDQRNAFA